MPIDMLYRYYQDLLHRGLIPGYGYETKGIGYGIVLRDDGTVSDIMSFKEPIIDKNNKDKGLKPKEMNVPRGSVRSSNIHPFYLWDNAPYTIWGYIGRDKKETHSEQKWEAAQKLYHKLNCETPCTELKEICSYYDKEHPELLSIMESKPDEILKDFDNSNFTFVLSDGTFALENTQLRSIWDKYVEKLDGELLGKCIVTGKENIPIARLHNKIMRVPGGLGTGVSLVSFQIESTETKGHISSEQGLNAPISTKVEFAYNSALNYLLSNPQHSSQWNNTTVVYWTDEDDYTEGISNAISGDLEALHEMMNAVGKGKALSGETDGDIRYHIIGFIPSAGRLGVAFAQSDSMPLLIENVKNHYEIADICHFEADTRENVTLYSMLKSISDPAVKNEKQPPAVLEAFWRSIAEGKKYPHYLFHKAITRCIVERKITRDRASLIKAILIRNYERTDLTMALNENSENKAYNIGRVFAIVEKMQRDALNVSTMDRCFPAACTTPANCMPRLMQNIPYYAKKSKYGKYFQSKIESIMANMNPEQSPFPKRFNEEETGRFMLGYYQQKVQMYTKKTNEEKESEEIENVEE